jgi:Cu/Ag efflux protein CusF
MKPHRTSGRVNASALRPPALHPSRLHPSRLHPDRLHPGWLLTARLLAGLTLAGAGVFGLVIGCDTAPTEPDGSYVVRGRVRGIARTAPPRLSVQHEAIDDFVSRESEVVGMPAMVMEFDVEEDVSLEGLAIDEVVEIAFDVRWSGDSMLTITRVTKLPPSTPLTFEGSH